jgi:capsular polysaccharide biosynthesis protein
MPDSFDAYEYFRYLKQRWWHSALACGTAAAIALLGCALMTKQYSATASILIDPPPSSDVRTAVAVSPVYLESLRTYEYFAGSDSLFQKAAQQFHLTAANPSEPFERLKKRVLKVTKLRDTKILEITATLPDPQQAAALASFLAAQTAALSQSVGRQGDQDLIANTEKQLQVEEKRLSELNTSLQNLAGGESNSAERYKLESLIDSQSGVERELMRGQADLAEKNDAGLQRRVSELQKQSAALKSQIAGSEVRIARTSAKAEALEADIATTMRERDALRARVRDLRAVVGTRGERLSVIDSGVVPQRPSSPKTPLIVISAFLLSFVASILYLSVGFSLAQLRGRASLFQHVEHERKY